MIKLKNNKVYLTRDEERIVITEIEEDMATGMNLETGRWLSFSSITGKIIPSEGDEDGLDIISEYLNE